MGLSSYFTHEVPKGKATEVQAFLGKTPRDSCQELAPVQAQANRAEEVPLKGKAIYHHNR